MQIQNLAKQHVTLKINDGGPLIQGTVTDVQEEGVWIALSKDYWLKLVGQAGSGYAEQQLNCFVPFPRWLGCLYSQETEACRHAPMPGASTH